jgi:hypothetical protein
MASRKEIWNHIGDDRQKDLKELALGDGKGGMSTANERDQGRMEFTSHNRTIISI